MQKRCASASGTEAGAPQRSRPCAMLVRAMLALALSTACTKPRLETRDTAAQEASSANVKAAPGSGYGQRVEPKPIADASDSPAAHTTPPAPPARVPGSCPSEMARIPAGTFTMGMKGYRSAPLHKVTLSKPYCIDRTEVTLDDYLKCERSGYCEQSAEQSAGYMCNKRLDDRGNHPMNCVSWDEADRYCRWRSKRLPTDAEWEFAARGPKSFVFPWGNRPPTEELAWNSMYTTANRDHAKCAHMGPEACPKRLNHSPGGTTEVGKYPKGASPFGVLDMGGNVSEWVQDWDVPWAELSQHPAVDPRGPAQGRQKVIKDLSWEVGYRTANLAERGSGPPDKSRYNTVGFRCALSDDGAAPPERPRMDPVQEAAHNTLSALAALLDFRTNDLWPRAVALACSESVPCAGTCKETLLAVKESAEFLYLRQEGCAEAQRALQGVTTEEEAEHRINAWAVARLADYTATLDPLFTPEERERLHCWRVTLGFEPGEPRDCTKLASQTDQPAPAAP